MRVITSWDDGHPMDLRIAELLHKHGLKGTFFVPGRNEEGLPVMRPGEIQLLHSEFEIGSHTIDHRYLDRQTEDEAKRSISQGKEHLEHLLGDRVGGFAYPGGRYSATITNVVRNLGLDYARTVENLTVLPMRDRYHLPTTLQLFPHARSAYVRNLIKYPGRLGKLRVAAEAVRQRSLRERIEGLIDLAAERPNGLFHLWGHSWEIERNGLWNTLDWALSVLAAAASKSMTVGELAMETDSNGSTH